MATCTISQYDFNTGTRLVISGLIQLIPATINVKPARTVVSERVISERLANNNPPRHVAQLIKIIDSYPLLHGAWPDMYHRMASPAVSTRNKRRIKTKAAFFRRVSLMAG